MDSSILLNVQKSDNTLQHRIICNFYVFMGNVRNVKKYIYCPKYSAFYDTWQVKLFSTEILPFLIIC